ncbi:hypothetical protein F4803DRAFT_530348 [Xylaria telfairii]|nr:hypothetical protein F4803DRAFT_530348 [Xylaria telfairii]
MVRAIAFIQLSDTHHLAAYDVVAHDVEFGEVRIDYLNTARENYWTQLWVSQGVDFIYRLMTENSNETKRGLLALAFGIGSVSLPEGIETMLNAYSKDILDTEEAGSKDELRSLVSCSDNDDTDNGPFEAWYAGHAGVIQ